MGPPSGLQLTSQSQGPVTGQKEWGASGSQRPLILLQPGAASSSVSPRPTFFPEHTSLLLGTGPRTTLLDLSLCFHLLGIRGVGGWGMPPNKLGQVKGTAPLGGVGHQEACEEVSTFLIPIPLTEPVPLTETLPSQRDGEQAASASTAECSLLGFLFATAQPKAAMPCPPSAAGSGGEWRWACVQRAEPSLKR